MEDRGGQHRPFDEQAALADLERVREQIQRCRAERKALQHEFSQWVRSFKPPAESTAEPVEDPPASRAGVPAAPMAAPEPASAPAAIDTPPPVPRVEEPTASDPPPGPVDSAAPTLYPPPPEQPPSVPLAPAPASPPRTISRSSAVVGGGLILLAGGAMAAWMLRGEAPPRDQVSQTRPAPPAAAPAAADPPVSPPPPAAAPAVPASQGSELVTTRRVWIRVLVDGERVLEREVPADTRVPLRAQKTIVIRTGDAGAVRLSLAGEDQGLLGREGEVVTRTFTVPPR